MYSWKYHVTRKAIFKTEAGQRLVVTTTSHQKIYVFRICNRLLSKPTNYIMRSRRHKGHKESLKNLFIKRNIFSARQNKLKVAFVLFLLLNIYSSTTYRCVSTVPLARILSLDIRVFQCYV